MNDIETRADIETLVNQFYVRVREDEIIGSVFNEIIRREAPSHLPMMYDFWDNILFYSGKYSGNPINLHRKLHNIKPIDDMHFSRWVQLFIDTVDDLFEGEKADLAKQRARSISMVIKKNIYP